MTPARTTTGAVILALALGAALAGCKGAGGDPADAGTDAPIIIRPDNGPPDPGPQDPGDPQDTATDPGKDAKDTGSRDTTEDPGGEDPGEFDPGDGDPGSTDPGCTPNCTGKECGTDGCGGQCGNCTTIHGTGWSCVAAECINTCVPSCAAGTCGNDGCGGTCDNCPADRPCTVEFQVHCALTGPCARSGVIACKDLSVDAGTSATSSNSDKLDIYPAACQSARTPGPERAYKFIPDQSGSVTFTLSGQKTWIGLYFLEGTTCSADACIASSPTSITHDVVQGTTYWIVIDDTKNDPPTAAPSLAIDCSWYVATSDP
jgi:hypothetical protein